VEGAVDLLLGAWALVDILQLPLIAAVLLSWRLTRTLGRAWKATAVAFGGYAIWIVATARLVPFAPSGFLLIVIGTILAPWRGATPERAWVLGSAAGVVIFWAVPVGIVWSLTAKKRTPAAGRPRALP
jgi:hypothetical protein